jgi:VanZ family protein
MSLSRTAVIIFRVMLIVSLLLITYFLTTELKHPIMTSVNDKLGHILAFIYLAFLVDYSFPASRFGLLKILPLLAYGLFIEVVQHYLPHRMFSILDILADSAGIVIYILFVPVLKHVPILKLRWV